MKLYISGQITGLDLDEAFLNFNVAESHLRTLGHEPVNPMTVCDQTEKTWAEYMAADIIILDQCDGIYMLPNWRQSKGAKVEHFIAEVLGKHIFYAASEIA